MIDREEYRTKDAIRAWVNWLLEGKEGEQVVKELYARAERNKWKKCTILSKLSQVKRQYLDTVLSTKEIKSGKRNTDPSFDDTKERLRKIRDGLKEDDPCRRKLDLFLGASLRQQYAACKRHRKKNECTGVEDVDAIYREMKVLPDNMDAVRPRLDDVEECNELSRENLEKKNSNMITIRNGQGLIDRFSKDLHDASDVSLSRLILALCGVSGRRMTEIANGSSRFVEMSSIKNGARFYGQLKQQGPVSKDSCYSIPLLVPFAVFNAALQTLRERQGTLTGLTNTQVSTRYQSNARREMKEWYPELPKIHALRSFYAIAAYKLFDWGPHTMAMVTKHILGHGSLGKNFFAYSTLDVQGLKVPKKKVRFRLE